MKLCHLTACNAIRSDGKGSTTDNLNYCEKEKGSMFSFLSASPSMCPQKIVQTWLSFFFFVKGSLKPGYDLVHPSQQI